MPLSSPAELKALIRDFRRDQIIDVARRLFGERGTTEVPMDEIATEAGVARSTLYVYFANREELLRACLQRMHTLLLDSVVASWERDSAPVERLRTLVLGMLERIDDNPAFFRLAVAVQGVPNEFASTVGAELDLIGLDVAGLIRDVIEQGTLSGDFRLLDADKATTFVGQQLYGAMSVRAGEPTPAPVEEAAAELCTFLLHGLAGPAWAAIHGADTAPAGSSGAPTPGPAVPDTTERGGRRLWARQRTMVSMRRRHSRPSPPPRTAPDGDVAMDLTVLAVPFYFASMAGEYLWLRRRVAQRGPTAGDYEKRDTLASLAMGVGSLVAPLVMPKLLKPFTPGRGRYGKALVVGALGAAAATTVADLVTRRIEQEIEQEKADGRELGDVAARENGSTPCAARAERPMAAVVAQRVSSVGGVVAVVAGGVAITSTWASRTTPERLWRRRILPDLGTGSLALVAAIVAWDFLYYWDHRFMHTSRYMWAIHVVHHSSEHYNLSTALRQPVAEAFGTFVPFGSLCLFGIRPQLVETARGVNLLYQYWIHTETLGALGTAETVLNSPSHHRVHHGSNRPYLDRNHGSILILWDRLFGTFEPEGERVVYGLTKNINTFNPGRIATHEYVEMLRDVASSTTWRERLSYIVRGPGWATAHRDERAGASVGPVMAAPRPPDLEVPVSA